MTKFLKNILYFLNFIAALLLLVSYLSTHISPETIWIPALLGLAYPYLVLTNIIFIILWIFIKPFRATLSILVIVVGYQHLLNYFPMNSKDDNTGGIKIVSFNLQNFYGIESGKSQSDRIEPILDYLESLNADIICLQEANLTGLTFESFKKKYNALELPNYGMLLRNQLIMSRFPIINHNIHRFNSSGNQVSTVDLSINEDTVRIFNCHLQSYHFSQQDISFIDSLSFDNKGKKISDLSPYTEKLQAGFKQRAAQSNLLKEMIDDWDGYLIVCGDFNDTPVSYTYKTVKGDKLADAFVESGFGIGNTYRGKLPSFRIDYILHSKNLKASGFEIGDINYSDHYPIHCYLTMDK